MGLCRGVTRGHDFPGTESLWGGRITAGGRRTAGGAEKSQQRNKYFVQYSTFAFERPQVRTWGRQTCFFAGRHQTSLRPWVYEYICLVFNRVDSPGWKYCLL